MDELANDEPVAILLVEDDPDDAELTMRALTRTRLANRVVRVRDGAEAIDFLFAQGAYVGRAGAQRPRLVLLDLGLPKLAGIEVLQRIRADERTRTMPVVALTSSSAEHDMAEAGALGVNAFITKPVDFADFRRLVEELGIYWLVGSPTSWSAKDG
jgi:two-component system, response regulator